MTNQIAGLRLTGTVSGEGNINLVSVVPNVGSVPASNLTVGQSGWAIIQSGTGATSQREISYCTFIADTPGVGILERGEVDRSTSANAKINFAADTTVIVEFDVPDRNTVHKLPGGLWHLLDELGDALQLPITTDNLSVSAGNVNTLLTCDTPEASYLVLAQNVEDESERVGFYVYAGEDDGGGNPVSADAHIHIDETGDFTLEQSGLDFNLRNNSGVAVTFKKIVQRLDRL